MRNTFKIFGIFMIVFIMILSMGASIFAETTDLNSGEGNPIETQPEEGKQEEQGSEKQISQDKEAVVEVPREGAEQESQVQGQEEQKSDNDNHEESDRIDPLLEGSSIQSTVEKLEYKSDTHVFQLDNIKSNNDLTLAVLAWMYKEDTYLAVISHEEIEGIIYQNDRVNIKEDTIKRAVNSDCNLVVNDFAYGPITNFAEPKNLNNHSRWSVIKIEGKPLTFPFKLTIEVESGGPHNINDKEVHVDKLLQVYHQYDKESPILDRKQSGVLDDEFRYKVQPQYDRDGMVYQLIDIKVIYNGEEQSDIGKDNLVDGYLIGQVSKENNGEQTNISVKIIFIYEKADKGSLTLINRLEEPEMGDIDRKFDIFIYGPKGKVYTVSLAHEESETLKDLPYGEYKIKEIVPMNFENISSSEIKVEIDNNTPYKQIEIKNQRRNSGWFYHEDLIEKTIEVGS